MEESLARFQLPDTDTDFVSLLRLALLLPLLLWKTQSQFIHSFLG